ncbi:MotB family protein [Rhizobium sp. SSA_523]|uniref:MotB family protein n=1 Tax=Rhizobium sp. SSA_523 TaxID=2952477 RepID=UPI0020915653|nr:MotB family protein [Rhizobium sp. SSA_523]MCO5733029.1 MotB family protein [Rhizobium sp. SSA_523]WKC23910.1 MotB family protein [Rhizobium sp. SSA_523]
MSEQNHHHGKNEIIIVKKHGGGHDGAHGGAWKIAYADFMTAMMAFFLVMWLVNAANEETKASVASYFNPIKLSDDTPAKKGLEKPTSSAEGEQTKERSRVEADADKVGAAAATGEDQTSSSGEESNYSEADFFQNPYSVLAEIAQEVGQQANVSAKGEGGANNSGPATGADGGEAYRDPFDPDFWTKQIEVTRADGQNQAPAESRPVNAADEAPTEMLPPVPPVAGTAPSTVQDTTQAKASPEDKPVEMAVAVPQPRPEPTQLQKAADKPEGASAASAQSAESAESAETQANALKQEIEAQIGGVAGKLPEGLIVKPAEGGVLITISDQLQTPMFDVGSAVPRRELVLAMEKIGQILQQRRGDVVIRGHTDARPFKDATNDNWRLSAARAHSAFFMLVKGGLADGRVKQISGFADRRPQVPDDPMAPQNRRIEILLEGGET